MATKTKTIDKVQGTLGDLAQNLGMAVMVTAAMAGLVDLPEQDKKPAIIVPNKPAFDMVAAGGQEGSNPLRREREETAPHHISYSETQRTPGRTGRY